MVDEFVASVGEIDLAKLAFELQVSNVVQLCRGQQMVQAVRDLDHTVVAFVQVGTELGED